MQELCFELMFTWVSMAGQRAPALFSSRAQPLPKMLTSSFKTTTGKVDFSTSRKIVMQAQLVVASVADTQSELGILADVETMVVVVEASNLVEATLEVEVTVETTMAATSLITHRLPS